MVSDHNMNNSRYDDFLEAHNGIDQSIFSDPSAFFEQMGAGKPGGLPMPAILTSSVVRSKSKSLSSSIFDSWNSLRAMAERHEATIRKRWSKKTREQRKKILLAVWPDMATLHRPDIDAFKRKKTSASSRAAYLWPSVNLDDLSKPKLFLIFLNARARNQPFVFAQADIDACRFGIISQNIVPGFLNEYVMMFTGRTDPTTYGELIAWDDHADAFDWLSSRRGAHPGEGLLILEIQDRVYKLLTDCCKEILRDMTEAVQVGSDVSLQPEPPSMTSSDLGLGSIASSSAEAPYRVPAELNLERLESIIEAKLLSAQDHLWSLREDPDYFFSVMQEYKDHRQETMVDVRGKGHPLLTIPTQERIFWERVIKNSIVTALPEIEIWGTLLDKVVDLRRLAAKYATEIDPKRDLPEEYAFAIYTFYHHLKRYIIGPIDVLKHGFVASPPMRPYFVREPQAPGTNVIRVMKRAGIQGEATRDTIIWIFMTLFDKQQLHLAGLNTLMDELERIQSNEPKARNLISSWVADKISDLAILSHCRYQIELYQPWAALFEDKMAEKQDDIDNDFLRTQKSFEKYFDTEIGNSVISIGTPHNGRFRYPAEKRRTRENTEAMRQAEKNLDDFWHALDRKLASAYAASPRVQGLLSERILERTPEWVEPIKPAKPADADTGGAQVEPLVRPLTELRFESQDRRANTVGRDFQQPAKVKAKTRGMPSVQTPSSPIIAASTQPDAQPTFSVDRRAFKVFKTIFHSPSVSSQPGEIAWHDFVHALFSTCFTVEKLYGSVWQFSPKGLDVERSIHFHEPHPGGKIPFVKARRHGRRLHRAYGWHGGMFALASE